MRAAVIAGFAAALMLAGCGTNQGDRAASGALIGAAGGVVGAATDPCDLNLGDPVWRDHGGARAYQERCGRPYRERRDRY
jgi:hypothetical protein